LRGPDPQRSPFVIDPDDVRAGLAALVAAQEGGAPLTAGSQVHPRMVGPEVLHLRFGAGGNGLACLRGKWHEPEARHTWCKQDKAIIEVPAGELPTAEYWLEIRGFSVSYRDYMPARRLGVSVNGSELVQTRVTGNARVIMRLPASLVAGRGSVTIEIDYPVIGPAYLLGAMGDVRKLGIGLTDIVAYAI
jgi:hypothetical protein